jgi:hypothetical protein
LGVCNCLEFGGLSKLADGADLFALDEQLLAVLQCSVGHPFASLHAEQLERIALLGDQHFTLLLKLLPKLANVPMSPKQTGI